MTHEIMAFQHGPREEEAENASGRTSIEGWADRLVQSAPDWMQDRRPSLLVIAQSPAHPRFDTLIDSFGARCLAIITPAQAVERIARIADVDVIVLDAPDAACLFDLLPLLVGMVRDGGSRLILSTPIEGLDAGDAALARYALLDAPVQWLCAPEDADWVAAFALACNGKRHAMALHDAGRESDASRLQRLSDEVERLARALDMLRTGNGGESGGTVRDRNAVYAPPQAPGWPIVTPPAQGPDGEERMTAQTVRDLLRSRRLREQFFGDDLFGDPAWDMMLDLMAARLAGERVSVSSLCIASAVPPTTALRWIRHLTDRGIFERRPDPLDGRRVFIALADDIAETMQQWYTASRRARRESPG